MEETGLSINPSPEIATAPPRVFRRKEGEVRLSRPVIPSPAPFIHTRQRPLWGSAALREGVARWGRQRPRISLPLPLFEASLPLTIFMPTATLSGSAAGRLWGGARPEFSPSHAHLSTATRTLSSGAVRARCGCGMRGSDLARGARTSGCACASGHRPARCGERPAASVRRGGAPPVGGTPEAGLRCQARSGDRVAESQRAQGKCGASAARRAGSAKRVRLGMAPKLVPAQNSPSHSVTARRGGPTAPLTTRERRIGPWTCPTLE